MGKAKKSPKERQPFAKSMPPIHWKTDEQAYRALKWFAADAVRLIRDALDNGSTPSDLLEIPEGINGDMVQAAIRFMSTNPNTGRVRWLHGDQWDWVPDAEADSAGGPCPICAGTGRVAKSEPKPCVRRDAVPIEAAPKAG
jgi:hypothetical protein